MIKESLDALKQSIASAYEKAEEKGGIIPTNKNVQNLPGCIETIKPYDTEEYTNIISLAESKSIIVEDNDTPLTLIEKIRMNTVNGEDFGKLIDGSLENVTIPEGTTEIRPYFFSGLNIKNEIVIPNTVTKIGERAFYNTILHQDELVLPTGLLVLGSEAFNGLKGVKKIEIPYGISRVCSPWNNSELEEAILPQTLVSDDSTSFNNTYKNLFNNMPNLKQIIYPDLWNIQHTYEFSDSYNIKRIKFGNSWTRWHQNIISTWTNNYTFTMFDCGLAFNSFDSNAPSIRSNNFQYLVLRNTVSPVTLGISPTTFFMANSKIRTGQGHIFVPQALLGQYRVATNWSALISNGGYTDNSSEHTNDLFLPIEGNEDYIEQLWEDALND